MKIVSPYLHRYITSNGDCLLLEVLQGKFFRVKQEQIPLLDKALEFPDKIDDRHILVENNIIIEDNIDHIQRCDKLYEDFVNKKDYLHLVILPTEDCNFRCSYCYEDHRHNVMSEELMKAVELYVEKEIGKYQALRVEWFGGEPLYEKEIVFKLSEKLIAICKNNKKPYYASMTTNGYYLSLETFRKLLKCKIVRFQVTLDGSAPTHDKQRVLETGEGTYGVILSNLLCIRDNIHSNFFNITIRCNVTSENYMELKGFAEEMKENFGNDARFNFLWKIAWNPQTGNCDTYLDQSALRDVLHENAKHALRLETNKGQLIKYGDICYASNKNSFIIGSDGSVYKCTVAFQDDRNRVGMLRLDGTMELDNQKIKFWTERKTCFSQNMCYHCFLYPSCLGIYCNLNNENQDGEFVCSGVKTYVDDYLECIEKCSDMWKYLDLLEE
jgi:uncharacterized protein